jgi:MFS family permease
MWVPLAVKYGRRVVYTSSFLAFGLCCIWSARASTYGSVFASRFIAAWFAGSAECVAPITIADIFFLHERGKMTAYVQPQPSFYRNAPILTTAF